jgi:hypothetical protein
LGGNVPDLRPTQPSIQWVPQALPQRVNWPVHEAEHSPLSHEVLSLHGAIRRGADKSLTFPIFLFSAQPKEFLLDVLRGTCGSVVVKALCCKPKVAGSSPDEVDFLKIDLILPAALGSTQPLTEMSTRNL